MKIAAHLVFFALLAGCFPAAGAGGGGGGGNGDAFGPVSFQMPTDGVEVSDPFVMTASGLGVNVVFFSVDGVFVRQTVPPFEFTVDPMMLPKGPHELQIEAKGSVHTEVKEVTIMVVRVRPSVEEMSAAIDALLPGEWYEIPETNMRDVDLPFGHEFGQQESIIASVSGGAYDTKRDRYIVWGGGSHSFRNEVTVFDMNTYTWNRLNDPTPFPAGVHENIYDWVMFPDGSPMSRHTYGTVQYIPEPIDRLYVGGGIVESANGFPHDHNTYLFDFDTLTWTPGVQTVSTSWGAHSAVGPDLRVWQQGAGSVPDNSLSAIDLVAQTATEHAAYYGFLLNGKTASIDPLRNEFISVGDGETRVMDLDNPDNHSFVLATSGDTEIEAAQAPGFEYHPPSGRFVAWQGGKDVYTLDATTAVWTRVPGQGTVEPGGSADRGTFNRWRYVPSKGVFIVVSSVDQNVFVYKHG
jgi:hypothetical protein